MEPLLFTLKRKLYLILPLIVLFLWAYISLFKDGFSLINSVDFPAFYYAGKFIFTNPEMVYINKYPSRYFYLPSFAMLFSVLSLMPYEIAVWIFFFIILIFGVLSIIQFDKILILKGVDNKFNRFIFLIVISNGLLIMQVFDYLQTKFIVLFLLLLFLKREIEKSQHKREDDLRFLFAQLMILIFALSMIPHYFFLLIIYLLNNTRIESIFYKSQLKKYFLCLFVFLFQNIMFLIFPILIFDFLKGFSFQIGFFDSLSLLYYFYNNDFLIVLISIISMTFLCISLSFHENLSIDSKFGYFILFSLFLNTYINQTIFSVLLPLVLLLFVYKMEELDNYCHLSNYFIFIKKNRLLFIGLFCISMLYFMHPIKFYYRFIPQLSSLPMILIILRWTIVYLILTFDLYLLKKRRIPMIEIHSKIYPLIF
jgi:hypothetical protein